MVRIFLPDMVERKYGRIVSICSIIAMNSLSFLTAYTATKWGVDGFMNALYDELCALDLEDCIKLTTIYPDFVSSRKELDSALDELNFEFNRLTPQRVAREAVEAIKNEQRLKIVSDNGVGHMIIQLVPHILNDLI